MTKDPDGILLEGRSVIDTWEEDAGKLLRVELTAETVAQALSGPLPQPLAEYHYAWIANATRLALAMAKLSVPIDRDALVAVKVRQELQRLSKKLLATWVDVEGLSGNADSRLLDFAFDQSSTPIEIHDCGDPVSYLKTNLPDFHRMKTAIHELEWLGNFLRLTAQHIDTPPRRYIQTAERAVRIMRARWLMPVYERAFGSPVTLDAAPRIGPPYYEGTKFMVFYQTIVSLAYAEHATRDLSGVLKEARELHRASPVKFPAGAPEGL